MKDIKRNIILLIIMSSIGVTACTARTNKPVEQTTQAQEVFAGEGPYNEVRFFDKPSFYNAIEAQKKSGISTNKQVRGITVPHHLLPSDMIAIGVAILKGQKPETIIILGPNHYEKGNTSLLISDKSWETPFGILASSPKTEQLSKENSVSNHSEFMMNDHAAAGIIPFVKYYLPDSEVIPILVSNRASLQEIDEAATNIAKLIDDKTVIIGAFDFSHYRNQSEAEDFDKLTIQAIKTRNYNQIFNFTNDYTDSPRALTLMLKLLETQNITEEKIVAHTNSGKMLNNPYVETTSYISIVFQ